MTVALSSGDMDVTPYLEASGAPEDADGPRGWGSDPIDLTPLRLADASLSLRTAGIRYDKFDFGPSVIAVALNDGKLVADMKQTSLFGGKGGALFIADGSRATPAGSTKANIDALALKPFLMAAADFGLIEGTGDVTLDIAGSGANLGAMMNSLVGTGAFKFDDGLVRGVDFAELGAAAKTALTSKSISLAAFGE